jgi:hypothetical protein
MENVKVRNSVLLGALLKSIYIVSGRRASINLADEAIFGIDYMLNK